MFDKTYRAAALVVALAVPAAAQAQTVDTFDRADGPLGSNYTTQANGIVISNGAATSQYTFSPNLVTFNGSAASRAAIDIANRPGNYGYVALSLGYRPGFDIDSYFVKVQDNNGDGLFDRYAFRKGNDYSGSDTLFAALGVEFATGTMEVSYLGTVAMLTIASAAGTQTYSYDYGFAPVGQAVGFGIQGNAVADNFRIGSAVAVPGPLAGAGLLPLLGLAGAWFARRTARAG